MGMAIGAAGSLLGGMAAKAIMGEPASVKADTNIPGISNATVQKKTKANDAINVAQVNSDPAINYFKQAAENYQNYATQGLGLYNAAIQGALSGFNDYSTSTGQNLQGTTIAGNVATQQYMNMLGLGNQYAMGNISNQLSQLGYSDLAGQMGDSFNSDFVNTINSRGAAGVQSAQQAVQQAQAALDSLAKPEGKQYEVNGKMVYTKDVQAQMDAYNAQKAQLQQTLQAAQGQLATAQQSQSDLSGVASQYGNLGNSQSSAESISDMLTKTPGYQFQLGQGLQGVARQAAAGGLGASGNALLAANQYAQDYAQNAYQGYLGNLNTVMQQGQSAATNVANANAQLYGNIGNAALNTMTGIGTAYNNAYTNAGQTFNQNALYNAQAQNQAMTQKRQNDFTASQNAQSNALNAGYLNLQQNQFAYQVQQNQNYGAGASYASNQGSSGSSSPLSFYNYNTGAWYT